ncbi:13604_t:CDS:2 [Dentiscutata erythropus]|uniref:13604_t:CDS:1 n=1 Tax=Dentiscutata erythropus TaxID=1348616 RepID=A0A9N9DX22_9GLOM|nr:13604_t:CDS:2 [Dentiscutata erythropus]
MDELEKTTNTQNLEPKSGKVTDDKLGLCKTALGCGFSYSKVPTDDEYHDTDGNPVLCSDDGNQSLVNSTIFCGGVTTKFSTLTEILKEYKTNNWIILTFGILCIILYFWL